MQLGISLLKLDSIDSSKLERSVMRSIVIALLTAFATGASGSNEFWLAEFAKRNNDKFVSELEGIPKKVTVRIKPEMNPFFNSTYDQDRKMLIDDLYFSISSGRFQERCKRAGTFTGVTGLGARAVVQRMDCELVEIADNDTGGGIRMGAIELPMTPQQYRDMKAHGPVYEIDFEVGANTRQEVARDSVFIKKATISNPIEKRIRILEVRGEIKNLRLFTPDGDKLLAEFDRLR